jgi:hypothetical protein
MRKILMMPLAAAALLAAGALFPTGANAAPAAPSSGLSDAVKQNGVTENVAYVCRRVFRFGYWQRRCFYAGGPAYYGGYGYYGPRPFYGYGYGYRRYGYYGRRW